jgi:hypothetical protein
MNDRFPLCFRQITENGFRGKRVISNVSRTLGWFDRDKTAKEIRKILRSFAMAAES